MSAPATLNRPNSVIAVWIAAIRPATLWAGAVPVIVAAALVHSDGLTVGLPSIMALVGALLIQIGTNLVNDYADFKSGADGPDRLGPARAAAQGWLTPRALLVGAALALSSAALCGIYIVSIGGWPMLAIGVASLICAIAYTAGPVPLGYVGLGDIFVLVFFGLAAVCGTYYLEAERVSTASVLVALAIGALATAILVVNNLRDRETDARVGKRTLAVRFGARFTRIEYTVLVLGAYLLVSAACLWSSLGWGALLVWSTCPVAIHEIRALWTKDGVDLNQHLGGTARLELLFGLALAGGVILWP
jgi:1,4-dihydroxy-2-naphthoate polyprenyltransferase